MERVVDVAIIGGGPAGLAAAISCYKQGIENIIILERDDHLGGILQQCIHNGFGLHWFGEELTGPEYADRFIAQVEEMKIPYLLDTMVLEISRDKTVYATNPNLGILKIKAKAIVLAMGCRERTRGALQIPGMRPAGVYTAGMAQRLVNLEGYMPGKEIVVLGSGDIGLIMARRMTWEGADVKMVCEIMPYSTGLVRNIRQCLEDNNIPLMFNHTVTKIHGDKRVEGVTIAAVDKNKRPIKGTEQFVACDTLLLSVGLIPENELSEGAGILLDPITGGPVVDEYRQTNVPGIFACGNVLQVHDLVDYVSEEAEMAGRGVSLYLKGMGSKLKITVKQGNGVRYIVPQIICSSEPIELFFRVDNIYKDGYIVLTDGNDVLYSKRYAQIVPGKMERIKLNRNVLKNIDNIQSLSLRWESSKEGEKESEKAQSCMHSVS